MISHIANNGSAHGRADLIERQYPGRQRVVLGIEEGCRHRKHPRQPGCGPDVRGVLAAFVLIDASARGERVYTRLDAELPLREARNMRTQKCSTEPASRPLPALRFSIAEAAQILRMSRALLYNRICEGTIRPQKDGARTYITRAELERYVDSCGTRAAAAR